MPTDKERVDLPLNEIPAAWYNVLADLPEPLPPPLHPGTGQPLTPEDLAPIFPMALIEQEMSPRALDSDSDGSPRTLQDLAPDAARPRRPPRKGAQDVLPHLFQERERQPRRQPQAQHRARPGLLQQAGRRAPPEHGDRRRPMGLGAGVRLPAFRSRVHDLHGEVQLSPETLPPLAHAHLGRRGLRFALRPHQGRPGRPRRGSRNRPAASASPSPRRWRTPPRTTTPSTPSAACSTTS